MVPVLRSLPFLVGIANKCLESVLECKEEMCKSPPCLIWPILDDLSPSSLLLQIMTDPPKPAVVASLP